MATRKLIFTGSTVLLAGDMMIDELLLAFAEQPVVFEVSSPTKDVAICITQACMMCVACESTLPYRQQCKQ